MADVSNPSEPRSVGDLSLADDRPVPLLSRPAQAFVTGSRVLHIGAPKTGTTAIQAAQMHLRDEEVGATHGRRVSVPGTPLEQARAALAVMGRSTGWAKDSRTVPSKYWDLLVRRVRASDGTVFVSSEFLCEADRPTIRRIVDELADGDVQVVLTLRPLARILPSAWQQYLKGGHELPYERWLRSVLAVPAKTVVTPSFWPRHDQGAVVERWAAEVGADRLTVIVLDPDDRGLLLRSFDELLGLPAGTLGQVHTGPQNRSMTAAEAELFRQINVSLRRHRLPYDDYAHLIRYGAIMRTVEQVKPGTDSAALATPGWALERAAELGRDYADRIRALSSAGLTVVGDLDRLSDAPDAGPDQPIPTMIHLSSAVEALLGTVSRAANGKAFFPDEVESNPTVNQTGMPGAGRSPAPPASELTARQLVAVLGRRLRTGVRRRGRRVRSGLAAVAGRSHSSSA
jgi:hypothetical protein